MEPLAPEPVTEVVAEQEKKSRWKLGGTASTALLLSFFFAVGLAGGVLYRLLPTTTSEKIAIHDTAPAAAPPALAQNMAASSGAAALPAKPASPSNAPSAPAQIAAAHPAPSPAASAPLPAVSPAIIPPPIAPIAGNMTPEAAQFAPTSDPAAATPPPDKSAATTPGKGKATATGAAKPKLALAKPKAPPVKHPAALATAASPSRGAEGPVRIQFGAFSIEDNAHRVQWTVEATGMPVEVAQLASPKGRMLYYVRSQPFPDRATALSAATTARDKAKTLVNPVAIEYIILPDATTPSQQAQVAGH
jgi:hypothetical protein